jgi:hypothetical protein
LSSTAWGDRCPIAVPWSSDSGFVTGLLVARSFISAVAVTADNATAVLTAARKPSVCNAARPTAAINKPRKGVRIIATASATIASASAPA